MSIRSIKTLLGGTLGFLLLSIIATAQNKPQAQTQNPTAGTAAPLPAGYPVDGKVNFMRTWQPLGQYTDPVQVVTESYQHVQQSTQYVDGLGRPLQVVQRQASPAAKDVVAPVVYDPLGRETNKYLPYVEVNGVADFGLFKTDPFASQKTFYQSQYKDANGQVMLPGENVFYSQTNYEPSPLNRIKKVMAPGNSWAGSSLGVEQQYLINTPADGVRQWTIGFDPLTYSNNDVTTNIPTSSLFYEAGQLQKQVTINEQEKTVVEYKDKLGHVVLKKVQLGIVPTDYSGHDNWLCTYYVYDDLGQLRFVLPPKAVEAIKGSWVVSSSDLINELCFRYEYDHKGRMIAKKAPGSGWVYLIYDARDRLVFTQDANLRDKGQWQVVLYDILNRPIVSGIMTYTAIPSILQASVTSTTTLVAPPPPPPPGIKVDETLWQPNSGLVQALNSITMLDGFVGDNGFVAEIYPRTMTEEDYVTTLEETKVHRSPIPQGTPFVALTKTFYDHYGWTNKTYTSIYNGYLDGGSNLHADDIPTQASTRTLGLITGTKTRVLEDPSNPSLGKWLTIVNFYDDKARVIQLNSENYSGGTDIATTRFDFSGKVLSSYLAHANPTATATVSVVVKNNFEYDHAGRLLKVWKTINNEEGKKRLVVQYRYDALGNLITKELGSKKDIHGNDEGVPVEILNYSFNVRGWLKGINAGFAHPELPGAHSEQNRYFGMELSYDWGFENSQLNGNIGGVRWRSKGDGEQRAYGFGYDEANRLLRADFTQNNSGWNTNAGVDFSVKMGDGIDPTLAYDANGNIKRMQQWGFKLGESPQIDDLQYQYLKGGNKLDFVRDGVTNDNKLGDFTDKNTTSDYGYDKNGNLLSDLNKGIKGVTGIDQTSGGAISYNHLNLPYQIAVQDDQGTDKGRITYIYDAVGNKLQKRVLEYARATNNNQQKEVVTTYSGGFVYEKVNTAAPVLQFFAQEEGRIRFQPATTVSPARFVYDYFVKDHLGNVRMVLSEEKQQDIYPVATLEYIGSSYPDGNNGSPVVEERKFYNINKDNIVDRNTVVPSLEDAKNYENNNGRPPYNNNPNCNSTSAIKETDKSQKLYKLKATSEGGVTGLGITLKVMAGDRIDIYGKSYYFEPNTSGSNYQVPVLDIFSGLLGAPSNLGGDKSTAGELNGIPVIANPVSSFLQLLTRNNSGEYSGSVDVKPKAYLNWVLLDENMKYVDGNFDRVGNRNEVKPHTMMDIEMKRSGYLYVYASNESPTSVYFDNLQVIHTKEHILEETHYYPFGLTMKGISARSFGSVENKYKFNGKELNINEFSDGSGLEQYDFGARIYDAGIGKWLSVDPKANARISLSPYNAMSNNPISRIDPDGQLDWVQHDGLMEFDSRVKDQEDAVTLYGKGAKWIAPKSSAASYTSKKGEKIVLLENGQFTKNGDLLQSPDMADVAAETLESVKIAASLLGPIEAGYGQWESGYDHINYPTTSGKLMRIRRGDGSIRSAQAQKYARYSSRISLTGIGFSYLANTLAAGQLYQQYQQDLSFKNINGIDVAGVGIGYLGALANTAKYFGIGGASISSFAGFTGAAGLGIQTYQSWSQVYQPWIDLTNWRPASSSAEGNLQMQSDFDYGIYNWWDNLK